MYFILVHIPISRPRGIPSGTKDINREMVKCVGSIIT